MSLSIKALNYLTDQQPLVFSYGSHTYFQFAAECDFTFLRNTLIYINKSRLFCYFKVLN